MKKICRERLLKLAKHLESGNLGHKIFTMSVFNVGDRDPGTGCGTAGCAIGECPIAFPGEWEFSEFRKEPRLIGEYTCMGSAMRFFGINVKQYELLFGPIQERSPQEEADVIRGFVHGLIS